MNGIRSLIAVLLAVNGPTLAAGESLDQRLAADLDGRVVISNVSGEIDVRGWKREEVHITGTLGENAELDVESHASLTEIKVRKLPGARRMRASDLVVRVPWRSELLARSVSANIDAREITGTQVVETVSGNIGIAALGGDLRIDTVSGDVRIAGETPATRQPDRLPEVRVGAVSGNVTLDTVRGDVEATSVSGNVRIRESQVRRARLTSTSGDLRFDAALAATGVVEGETISGDIDLRFDGAGNLDVLIESHSGEIENCDGPEAERKSKYGPGRVLRYRSGDGAQRLRVRSLSGRISLCTE